MASLPAVHEPAWLVMAQFDGEVRAFLDEPRIGVLATINSNGTPQQTAIWYELQETAIIINTRRGSLKDRNLRHDARCSLCVAEGYRYVTIRGSAQLINDQQVARPDAERLAARYKGTEEAERLGREEYSKQTRVTIRMSIDQVKLYGFRERSP